MKMIEITNLTRTAVGTIEAIYCNTFLSKLRGLIFKPVLRSNQGLLLVSSKESRIDSAIHMIGVLSDLTVVWIDHELKVVDVRLAYKNRLVYFPALPAQYVLELAPERLQDFQIKDQLQFGEMNAGKSA
jgi:uncharacterized membrane protein (UPF0127 family)